MAPTKMELVPCFVCSEKKEERRYFRNLAIKRKFTLSHCVHFLFPELRGVDISDEVLCIPCASKVTTAYSGVIQLMDKVSPESGMRKLIPEDREKCFQPKELQQPTPFKVEPTTAPGDIVAQGPTEKTDVAVTANAKPPTTKPVVAQIKEFCKRQKDRNVLHRAVANMVKVEMNSLAKDTVLRKVISKPEDVLPTNEVLHEEMRKSAPLMLTILQTILRPRQEKGSKDDGEEDDISDSTPNKKKKKVTEYVPEMRTIMGVILNSRNQKCSNFQKMIGLILFNGTSLIKTFEALSKFRLCCDYNTMVRSIDKFDGVENRDVRSFCKDAFKMFNDDNAEMAQDIEEDEESTPNQGIEDGESCKMEVSK